MANHYTNAEVGSLLRAKDFEAETLRARIAQLEQQQSDYIKANIGLTAENQRLETELNTNRNARNVLYAENRLLRADGAKKS
jgi:hypothetical protein